MLKSILSICCRKYVMLKSMTIQELRDQQEQAKQDGAEVSCIPYPECVERVQQTQEQAEQATEAPVENETLQQVTTQTQDDTPPQLVEGVDNNLLVIGGLVMFTIIILLMGILVALNREEEKLVKELGAGFRYFVNC